MIPMSIPQLTCCLQLQPFLRRGMGFSAGDFEFSFAALRDEDGVIVGAGVD